MKKILITGSCGFIGYHLSIRLKDEGFELLGIDNLNDYYDINLKKTRLTNLEKKSISIVNVDISDKESLLKVFEDFQPEIVVNLAAQAGVRYSIDNPDAYVESNLVGFMNILEACRKYPVQHLLYASSSSVYGGNKKVPFSTNDTVDHPVSLYAATKKSNELLAHSYSHLYDIPTTGLRFFTVYGPLGRPDMAYYSFTKNIIEGKPIKIFNEGEMKRDFTYIDDVVESIVRLLDKPPKKNNHWSEKEESSSSFAAYKIYNIGNSQPVKLIDFISIIEKNLEKTAIKEFVGMQDGDVVETYAETSDLEKKIDFKPKTSIQEGLQLFVEWYKKYYKVDDK